VQYDTIFSFTYSPRPNTSAKDMLDAVPEEEKSKRLAVLNERQRQIQIANNEKLVGETFEVLVDARHAARGQWTGRSTSNRLINFTSTRAILLGEYVSVRVTRGGPNCIGGEHVL
jgi:tRNA-2-methylthio-N6-dimethylallyladenosine synthase